MELIIIGRVIGALARTELLGPNLLLWINLLEKNKQIVKLTQNFSFHRHRYAGFMTETISRSEKHTNLVDIRISCILFLLNRKKNHY